MLKLLDVVTLPYTAGPQAGPGQVVALPSQNAPVAVGTGEGLLGLKTVQLEGRRVVSAGDFLRGFPKFLGAQL